MRAGAVVVLAAGVAYLAACSPGGSDPVRERFAERAVLPTCGALELEQGSSLETAGGERLACLSQALRTGAGAELRVTAPTTEGDPIVSYYRVTTQGTTEVYVDNTADAYGDGRWSYSSCDAPGSALEVNC